MTKPSFLRNFQTQDDGSTHLPGVDPIGIDGESRMTVVTLCGDLNHDELLSTMDVTLALQMAANNIDIDLAADANSDGAVTPVDVPLIWQSMISKAALARHA